MTVCSNNYLAQVRTLAASYAVFHPDGRFFVCLVDELAAGFDPKQEPFTILLAKDLGIPRWEFLTFRYEIVELNTAVKPFLFEYLFKVHGLDRVAYFDPDMVLYAPLDDLNGLLDQHPIILTPHIVQPVEAQHIMPPEQEFLMLGTYNLGFIALTKAGTEPFLKWWQARLYHDCLLEPHNGFFVDQHWMDLATSFFPDCYIWRDPGCNVGRWNLSQRPIDCQQGVYTAAGSPLKFMHYSGFDPANPQRIYKADRPLFSQLSTATKLLFDDYAARLFKNGYETIQHLSYAYGRFPDGARITRIMRVLYRQLDRLGERWADPYQIDADSFFGYMNSPFEPGSADRAHLTQLTAFIYQVDPEIQALFPKGLTTQAELLMLWFCSPLASHYQLDEVFLAPLRPHTQWELAQMLAKQQLFPQMKESALADSFAAFMNSPFASGAAERAHLTQLTATLYQADPALQARFPEGLTTQAEPLMLWFCSAESHYPLDEASLAPLRSRTHWETVRMLAKQQVLLQMPEGASFVDYLNSPFEPGAAERAHLTQLTAAIYQADPALQARFPKGLSTQVQLLMLWFCSAANPYQLEEASLAPLRPYTRWEAVRMLAKPQVISQLVQGLLNGQPPA